MKMIKKQLFGWGNLSLLLPLLACAGCISTPVIPKNAMPVLPASTVYASISNATGWLDCLSAQLCQQNKTIKLMVGDIRNTVGDGIGDIILPASMTPFVENSLGRIQCIYNLSESKDLVGIQGMSQHLPKLAGAYPELARQAALGDRIRPAVVITGSLFMAQTTANAGNDVEIFSFGLGAEVTAYDVSLQLKAVDARNRRFIVPPVTLHVRLFAGEHGVSVFFSDSNGNLTRAQTGFIRAPSAIDGLQHLSDFATAALIRDLSSSLFKTSYSVCDQEINGLDTSRVASRANPDAGSKLPVQVRIFHDLGTVCATAEAIKPVSGENVSIIWQQYGASTTLNIPLGPPLRDRASKKVLDGETTFCLPHNLIRPNTKAWEVKIYNENNTIIGVDAL
jgi:hypothetical protein